MFLSALSTVVEALGKRRRTMANLCCGLIASGLVGAMTLSADEPPDVRIRGKVSADTRWTPLRGESHLVGQ